MDNWEIQKLGLGTFVCDDTRNCGESGELRLHTEIYRCQSLSRVDFSTDGKSTNPVFVHHQSWPHLNLLLAHYHHLLE